jgi:hypothetical protein
LMPLSKVRLSLHRFSQNSQLLNGITWNLIYLISPKSIKKYGNYGYTSIDAHK